MIWVCVTLLTFAIDSATNDSKMYRRAPKSRHAIVPHLVEICDAANVENMVVIPLYWCTIHALTLDPNANCIESSKLMCLPVSMIQMASMVAY